MSRMRESKNFCPQCHKLVGRLPRHIMNQRCGANAKKFHGTRGTAGAQPVNVGGPTFQERRARIKQENYEARLAARGSV